jgi:hypothetical protein
MLKLATRDIYHDFPAYQDDKPTVTGRNVSHADRSALALALLAADLHIDNVGLIRPTMKQCALNGRSFAPHRGGGRDRSRPGRTRRGAYR